MTGAEVRAARATLGQMWGLEYPLPAATLGRLLGLKGRDPGKTILEWEKERPPITGPAATAITAMLEGWRRREFRAAINANRAAT